MTVSASAADLAPVKAPPPAAPLYNWTGFYIFGGAGGGIWAADQSVQVPGAALPLIVDRRQGGSGWFGTVGLGYDWQFNDHAVQAHQQFRGSANMERDQQRLFVRNQLREPQRFRPSWTSRLRGILASDLSKQERHKGRRFSF